MAAARPAVVPYARASRSSSGAVAATIAADTSCIVPADGDACFEPDGGRSGRIFLGWKKTAALLVLDTRTQNREGAHMRRILLALAFVTATAATPTLNEPLVPATAHAA